MPYQDNHPDDDQPADLPASVIFTELMRQAAAKQRAPAAPSAAPDREDHGRIAGVGGAVDPTREKRRQTAVEAQRIRRVQQRKIRKRRRAVGTLAGMLRTFFVVIVSGGIIATILSWWTSPDSLPQAIQAELGQINPTGIPILLSTQVPTPPYLRRIGIIAGHTGPENDPGAVCEEDGEVVLQESDVNLAVALLVREELLERGYTVDLLEEFDHRLEGYRADALVSIHANSCFDYEELVSGYLVGQAEARPPDSLDSQLVECIAVHYGAVTHLERRYDLTRDMADYHAFRQISVTTPGAIIEVGFMHDDREFITTRRDLVAQGIVDGILCFLEPGDDPLLYPSPTLLPFATVGSTETP